MSSHFLRDLAATWPPDTATHLELMSTADQLDALRAEVELAKSESRKARKRTAELAAEVERLRCDAELLRKLDSAASPEVSGMLNRYFVAALCESAAARLRFKDAAIDNLAAEVERLREERRWIPVEEGLPENYETVIAAWGLPPDRHPIPAVVYCVDGLWLQVGYKTRLQVTHWQPLPAPPKEE